MVDNADRPDHFPFNSRIVIPMDIWEDLMALAIEAAPSEVGGFGRVERHADSLYVSEVFCLPQKADKSSVYISPETLAAYIGMLVRANSKPEEIWFQWHTHAYMSAYFSPTDVQNIEDWPGKQLISLVLNAYGQHRMRIDTFGNERRTATVKPVIPVRVPEDKLLAAAEEIRRNVLPAQPGIARAQHLQRRPKTYYLDPDQLHNPPASTGWRMPTGTVTDDKDQT